MFIYIPDILTFITYTQTGFFFVIGGDTIITCDMNYI